MNGVTKGCVYVLAGVLAIVAGGQAIAQGIELKAQVLGTGYDRENRALTGELPAEGAVVKRQEGAKVVCSIAVASETETSVYHVWLYRGDEPCKWEPAERQATYYDSLTKETQRFPIREILDRTEDLRTLTDVRTVLVVKLRVGKSGNFRTHSMKKIDFKPSLGTWECRVYSADEKLLSKKVFTVVED
ncbi:MAG: DUF2914 domain-containing protein [bacterium]